MRGAFSFFVTIIGITFINSAALARPDYANNFLPAAIRNLNINAAPPAYACQTCHNNQSAFGQFNTFFGEDFFAEAQQQGFQMAQNNMTDLTQANVESIVNALRMVDSDGDGATNEAEFRANTNPSNPQSVPGQAGGNDPIEGDDGYFPGDASQSSQSGSIVSTDQAYQLNSSCAAQEVATMNTRHLISAGFHLSQVGSLVFWLIPVFVSILRRRKK